jgi:integrase
MRARSGDALDRVKAPEPFANPVPTGENLAHRPPDARPGGISNGWSRCVHRQHELSIPAPGRAIDAWTAAARITDGTVFRAISKVGCVWGNGMTAKVLWDVVRHAAAEADIAKLAPHDLRRTCARLCHIAGGELDQIQFLLVHVSIQTTERYLGCKQKLRHAVNDRLGIEPDAA